MRALLGAAGVTGSTGRTLDETALISPTCPKGRRLFHGVFTPKQ